MQLLVRNADVFGRGRVIRETWILTGGKVRGDAQGIHKHTKMIKIKRIVWKSTEAQGPKIPYENYHVVWGCVKSL